jgi:hypothetical protein
MSHIILVDDDNDFINSFKNEAYARGIGLSPANSLEGLKQLLPAYAHKFAAVVLDIKCLLKDNQAKEDVSFITAAISYLDSNIPGFPRFILTGDETEFDISKRYYKYEKIFVKKPDDQLRLLDLLSICVRDAEPLRIRRENSSIFTVFDKGLLPANKEKTVLNILLNYDEKDPNKFKGIATDVRGIHEEIYKSINHRNKPVVPDKYFDQNGTPHFTKDFYNHLLGYQDSTISCTTEDSGHIDHAFR